MHPPVEELVTLGIHRDGGVLGAGSEIYNRFTIAGERNWDYFTWRGKRNQRRGDIIVAFTRTMLRVRHHWYFSTASP